MAMPINEFAASRERMSEQWRGRRERGSKSLVRLIIWLALRIGRAGNVGFILGPLIGERGRTSRHDSEGRGLTRCHGLCGSQK